MENVGYSSKFKTPEEEIKFLRQEVLRHEERLKVEGAPIMRDAVIAEKIEEHKARTPSETLAYPLSIAEHEAIILDLIPRGTDSRVEELLGLLEVKGLLNTLSVIENMHDAELEDDFHRVLIQYVKKNLPVEGLKEKGTLFQALHMTLFEVTLHAPEEKETKGLKELLSSMEQFYAGVIPKFNGKEQPWLSFEIAVANDHREVVFYAAVPDTLTSLFEKQLLSIFPTAKIVEVKNDYNIFTDRGYVAGAFATLKENPVHRIKTYVEFDYDPLTIMLNAFSKVKEVGEGIALQFLVAAPPVDYIYRYKKALEDIEKGVPAKEALDIRETLTGEIGKDLGGLFKSLVGNKGSKKEMGEAEIQAKEALKAKMETPVLSVGIRIVASAETAARAEQLLTELEATFHQFEVTTGNSVVFKRYHSSELPELSREFSFRLLKQREMFPLSLRELATVFHFPTESAKGISELKQGTATTAPAPSDMGREGILLGVNRHRGEARDIYFKAEDRLRHFYIIGQTGTGKSTLLKNMLIEDIRNGEGVCMIDPHGSDIEDVLASIPHNRMHDVIYFDPSYTARPMGLNMLEYDMRFPEQKTFVANELIAIFNKLFDMRVAGGPAFEQYFRNAALLVMDDPQSGNTILEIGRVFGDKAFRDMKLSRCKNPIVVQFWQNAEKTTGDQALANFVPYITSKLDPFISNDIMRPIIAQEKSSFNFRDIMDQKKILLVNLSKGRLGDVNANFIGLILVGKMLMAALSRVDSFGKTLPPFYLYIDEFQNITTDSIATILSEARKYKLSLTIAHQFIAQLEDKIKNAVFGNVGSLAAFRVGADDAEYLSSQFSPTFTAKDIMNMDNRNAYLRMLVGGKPAKPFNIETMPLPKLNHEGVNALKELSYITFGKERALIDEDILRRYRGGK